MKQLIYNHLRHLRAFPEMKDKQEAQGTIPPTYQSLWKA